MQSGLRMGYLVIAWLLVMSIAIQVFLAGLNVFITPLWWSIHMQFGHWIGYLLIGLLLLVFVGSLPRALRWLTLLTFVLYVLQYNFRNLAGLVGVPAVAALHPVNALALFWCAVTMGRQAWQVTRQPAPDALPKSAPVQA